jgi:hypothetical protein
LFAEHTPDTAPADPIERQRHLNALALANLITSSGAAKAGRGEIVVVIDTNQPASPGEPVIDWGLPVTVPYQVLCQLADDDQLDTTTVIVRNGVIIHAPGNLNLGRTTRLANRDQRRARRALHPTCAIPGCTVRYDRCKLHHIIWWRNGGRTDLDNLIPLCAHHHSRVHNDDWQLTLGPNRELTIHLPDGTIHNTGPPTRRAA